MPAAAASPEQPTFFSTPPNYRHVVGEYMGDPVACFTWSPEPPLNPDEICHDIIERHRWFEEFNKEVQDELKEINGFY